MVEFRAALEADPGATDVMDMLSITLEEQVKRDEAEYSTLEEVKELYHKSIEISNSHVAR